ncbi:MAG: glycosyltransferase [Deltaproteobacteria bacterium]|nr:glycosyltransferase [Deltaproteobacteria bacterium]
MARSKIEELANGVAQSYDREVSENGEDSLAKIARWIPPGSTVLDLGTGPGALGRYLRDAKRCTVDGVEIDRAVADAARGYYRQLHIVDLENTDLGALVASARYDVIVCADVLEHLRDPAFVLRQLPSLLSDSGRVLISMPNVAYAGVIAGLLAGEFAYTPAGLLDTTHLRFYTRSGLFELLGSAGMEVRRMDRVTVGLYQSEFRELFVDAFPAGLSHYLLGRPEAQTYQFIVEAIPAHADARDNVALLVSEAPRVELQFSCRAYWRGREDNFDESRSTFQMATIGREHQEISLAIESGARTVTAIRIDPCDRPGFVHLHDLRLFSGAGDCVFAWDGSTEYLGSCRSNDLYFACDRGSSEVIAVATGFDPWFLLTLPDGVAGQTARVELVMSWPKSADYLAVTRQLAEFGVRVNAGAELELLDREVARLRRELDAAGSSREAERRELIAARAELEAELDRAIQQGRAATDVLRAFVRSEAEQWRLTSTRLAALASQLLQSRSWQLGTNVGDFISTARGRPVPMLAHKLYAAIEGLQTATANEDDPRAWVAGQRHRFDAFAALAREVLQSNRLRFGRVAAQAFNVAKLSRPEPGPVELLPSALDLAQAQIDLIARQIERALATLRPRNASTQRAIERPVLRAHRATVDIVVCVHNALDDVRACLESLIEHTTPPYNLILIDDGSREDTAALLRDFAAEQGAVLRRNEQARGYTFAANQGLRESAAEYVVLLNSDTIVTPGWIDRMVRCGESSDAIGAIGPFSNCASEQSIPLVLGPDGDWSMNPLPHGMTVAQMGELVAMRSAVAYPRVPFLNGFCYMIKRTAIARVGIFDEEHFGAGYGEENDYSLRLGKAGFELAIADDAYVFHHQSKSYSHERRKALAERAGHILGTLHTQALIGERLSAMQRSLAVAGARARQALAMEQREIIAAAHARFVGKRVAFLLPVCYPGGGANVVIQEALAMKQSLGVDVHLINLSAHREQYTAGFPGVDLPVVWAPSETAESIRPLASSFDAVIATADRSVQWMAQLPPRVVRGYYIQDYEPYFYPTGSAPWRVAAQSYTCLPDLVRFTKSQWNKREVLQHHRVDCTVVGPSLETTLFAPRGERPDHRRPRVLAMIRFETPRRNPELTLRVLETAWKARGGDFDVVLFGASTDDQRVARHVRAGWTNVGVITREQTAALFAEMDVFLDCSGWQAMGLTMLEAMACGVACIGPQRGGAGEFVVDRKNGILVDTASERACVDALIGLLGDAALQAELRKNAVVDVVKYTPELSAVRILDALFVEGERK